MKMVYLRIMDPIALRTETQELLLTYKLAT